MKINIELSYKQGDKKFISDLVDLLERAEFASITGDAQGTVIRGDFQTPTPRPATEVKKGGCW